MSDQPQRPAAGDRDAWRAYWQALGMSWRIEPEIDEDRQRFLAERRAVKPNIERGIYPFRDENGGIKLTRADVEWLLAMHESGGMRGPVDRDDFRQWNREGIDLRGANLSDVTLRDLPLAHMRGGLESHEVAAASPEQLRWAAVRLDGAGLADAYLERSVLRGASMVRTDLRGARLQRAVLHRADLTQALLRWAHLGSASLIEARLAGCDLRLSFADAGTALNDAVLSDKQHGAVLVADVRWGGVNLSVVNWSPVRLLGDESEARERAGGGVKRKDTVKRLTRYEAAVRANRQLATVLRAQGLNEHADRFAYRAQLLQRAVLRRQGEWLRWFGSLVLALIAGYGYRPLRSFATYLLVVGAFALGYLALGGAHGQPLSWNEAVVVSLTAFHGRGFFATAFQPGDPQAAVAAIEAVFGLLIEITFIATFTQRFFARN